MKRKFMLLAMVLGVGSWLGAGVGPVGPLAHAEEPWSWEKCPGCPCRGEAPYAEDYFCPRNQAAGEEPAKAPLVPLIAPVPLVAPVAPLCVPGGSELPLVVDAAVDFSPTGDYFSAAGDYWYDSQDRLYYRLRLATPADWVAAADSVMILLTSITITTGVFAWGLLLAAGAVAAGASAAIAPEIEKKTATAAKIAEKRFIGSS